MGLAVTNVVFAQSGGGGGNFLVKPGLGVMIWTLIAFGITLLILRKLAFPRIAEALDKRRRAIEESIDAAERTAWHNKQRAFYDRGRNRQQASAREPQ